MPIISIYGQTFTQTEAVAKKVAADLGYELVDDAALVREAASRFEADPEKLMKTVAGKVSAFNRFTREKERSLAWLTVAVADAVQKERLVLCGALTLLIPRGIGHVLSVCLVAEMRRRVELAVNEGMDGSLAGKTIKKNDEAAAAFAEMTLGTSPWDPAAYDILLPRDQESVDKAAAVILENARKDVLLPTVQSLGQAGDFALAAHVRVALVAEGHEVDVECSDGNVVLTINKHVLMLAKLEEDLKRIVSGLAGVKSVETRVGPGFHKSDIYRKIDFNTPSKVLLVDDEKEFVQTLSDRLQMRDMGSAVVFDGEQAIDFVGSDEPEVMVLDLNLPGMNGTEVLRHVKQNHPNVEVIILTGHGSEKDRDLCMGLGAFAYLEKPVDIDTLAETMREANAKAKKNKE